MASRGERQTARNRLKDLLNRAGRIVCLTGAGISTESGIPDFRSSSGLYQTITSEEIFDLEGFHRDPARFYRILGPVFRTILDADPNQGHRALFELERLGKKVSIVTQNIDALHQKGGSRVVHEIHGTIAGLTCLRCGKRTKTADFSEILQRGAIPYCSCFGIFKPDITFYGEAFPVKAWLAAEEAVREADLLLVLGTSLTVYPAASLPYDRRDDVPLVIINRTETGFDSSADLVVHDSIGSFLSDCVLDLL